MSDALLRALPKVDALLARQALQASLCQYGHAPVLEAARAVLSALRESVRSGARDTLPDIDEIAQSVAQYAEDAARPSLVRVVNATGVVLHTNLGRSPLSQSAIDQIAETSRGYSTLELSLQSGQRSIRHAHVAALLTELTGAEDAMVVGNNAAAVLLMLSSIASGREVIVSRGELVEIGGSFRVPEIMALSGAVLSEVGTTNRTHVRDYESAITERTGALFKAHTSNYRIIGFTAEVTLEELVSLGRAHQLPVLYDVGGGLLRPLSGLRIPGEPCVVDCVQAGVDLLCFSGDKLLGGPQAGILLGTKKAIAACAKHPLARAVRADKLTLAALSATLSLYRDEALAMREIPTLRMILTTQAVLREKAARLLAQLSFLGGQIRVIDVSSQIGGGTAPEFALPSAALAIAPDAMHVERLAALLREGSPPIIARIEDGALLLDVRTVDERDFGAIREVLQSALAKEEKR